MNLLKFSNRNESEAAFKPSSLLCAACVLSSCVRKMHNHMFSKVEWKESVMLLREGPIITVRLHHMDPTYGLLSTVHGRLSLREKDLSLQILNPEKSDLFISCLKQILRASTLGSLLALVSVSRSIFDSSPVALELLPQLLQLAIECGLLSSLQLAASSIARLGWP